MTTPPTDFDGPWKLALETYLAEFLAFFFPQAHADIDWARGYTFLDKELQQITPKGETGLRTVDKLIQLWRRNGTDTWVLVHIEVQSQEQATFAQRMFTYHARLFDRYQRQVVSMAVLGDERATWRPDTFGYQLWGCELQLRFPTIKLVDYREQWAALESNTNPFATVVLAHLTAQQTRQNMPGRAQSKLALTRRLYGLGYTRDQILGLYRFLDWLLRLPEELERQVWQAIRQYEEEQHMTYISTAERIGREVGREEGLAQGLEEGLVQGLAQGLAQGRREGLLDGIALALEIKFGAAAVDLMAEIRQLEDLTTIQAIYDRIKTTTTPDQVRAIYAPPPA